MCDSFTEFEKGKRYNAKYIQSVIPFSNSVDSFLDGEVGVVNLEDLEVVEADADVEGADAAGALHVHRRDVPDDDEKHTMQWPRIEIPLKYLVCCFIYSVVTVAALWSTRITKSMLPTCQQLGIRGIDGSTTCTLLSTVLNVFKNVKSDAYKRIPRIEI